ncbi:MAG: PAS domain-containing protein [Alphaproteobacteria bacterium]|nr:PAS domain-containing protein [Alphaproteobacteria bacterium]
MRDADNPSQASLSDLVFSAIGDGIWDWNIKTNRVYRSPEWQKTLGAESIGRGGRFEEFSERLHPEDRDRAVRALNQAVKDGSRFSEEYRVRHEAGHYVWVHSRGQVIEWDETNTPKRMIGSIRDITPRKEAELALQASEKRFSDLASNIPGAIFQYIQYADGSNRVLYMSPGCENIWEISSESVVEDSSVLWGMIDEADLPGMHASVARSMQDFSPWDYVYRITTLSGKRKWLHGRGQPQPHTVGDAVVWNSLVLDVTERQELEHQLVEANKLDALGQLTGGIAHDFNNHLGVILGNLDLLSERALLQPDQARWLASAVHAAEASAELTADLLSFSRRRTLRPTQFKVDDALEDLHRMLRRTLPESIRIHCDFASRDALISTDRTQFETALLNLANNARDAMPDGGTLTLRSRAPKPRKKGQHRMVEISVMDTGLGMDEATLAQATEPFFTTKPPGKGSGLGLSSAYGFANQSKGDLVIDTEPGSGTSVKLRLPHSGEDPALEAAGTVVDIDEALSCAPDSVRVLLLEDNPALIQTTSEQLQLSGFKVTPVIDPETALAVIHSGDFRPDVVLADIVLGSRIDGIEIAQSAQTLGIPSVLMSGHPLQKSQASPASIPQGVRFVQKPFTRGEIINALCDAVQTCRVPVEG